MAIKNVYPAEKEFSSADDLQWREVAEGAWEKVLTYAGNHRTVLLKWMKGFKTTEVAQHDHKEEVLILSGSLRDLTLEKTFGLHYHAYRPHGMRHGPYLVEEEVTMLVIESDASRPFPE